VIQNFKLELADKKPVDMVLRLIAVPSHPVRLRLKRRWLHSNNYIITSV